ncbi:MAG: rhomboid family intramembrane serine protease [Chloroflexi bacterium]|nr:rhomboid family intramembrane serine protease [Chloroflexota bacterium]
MNQEGYPEEAQIPPAAPPRQVVVHMPEVRPFVTYTLLGLSIVIYVLQLGSQALMGFDLPAGLGIKANEYILAGQLWRLITPAFLHSTDSILHIGFNMYALLAFGPGLERTFGRSRFLALYLLGGFAGNVLSFVFSPNYSLGSSTAIFGLLGAEAVFLYTNRTLFGARARRALVNILMVAGFNLFIGLSPGIDNWGHLGGLIGGGLFAWLGGPRLALQESFQQIHIVDGRTQGDILRAALAVFVLFAVMAILQFI